VPSLADRLGLADAYGERGRPAGAVAPVRGGAQELAGFFLTQWLDVDVFADGSIDEVRHVPGELASLPGHLQGAGEDPVDLHDGVGLEILGGEPALQVPRGVGVAEVSGRVGAARDGELVWRGADGTGHPGERGGGGPDRGDDTGPGGLRAALDVTPLGGANAGPGSRLPA